MGSKGRREGLSGEDLLAQQLSLLPDLPEWEREYRFAWSVMRRRWRFDFAFPEQRVGVEVEGGTWTGGRHVRGAGYEGDLAKYNAAVALGWRVLRYTPAMVADGTALAGIMDAVGEEDQAQARTGESDAD